MQKEINSGLGILIFLVAAVVVTLVFVKNIEEKARQLDISLYEKY